MAISEYDLGIVGGGLAGLSLAIQMARQGFRVILWEQKSYPFHRVCGEYIADESRAFLGQLGLDLEALALPQIRRLLVSDPAGKTLESPLLPGGFGISRHLLDHLLAQRAQAEGVTLLEKTRVRGLQFIAASGNKDGNPGGSEHFEVDTTAGPFTVRQLCGAFGKYDRLDLNLRPERLPAQTGVKTYVGIKYHLRLRWSQDLIALHNFAGGYCGISAIEADRVCACYLVSAEAFQAAGGQPKALEAQIQNPYLQSIFKHAEHLYQKPQAIAQVQFAPRSLIEDHVLMLGDAAGLIPPLCGNGMSMAFRASALLAEHLQPFLANQISRTELEAAYQRDWKQAFGHRLQTGRRLQGIFGRVWPAKLLVGSLKHLPTFSQQIITNTHGNRFSALNANPD